MDSEVSQAQGAGIRKAETCIMPCKEDLRILQSMEISTEGCNVLR
jgi:hypothetical protein